MTDKNIWLIVGLGNPGSAYEETRHNVGFRVVRKFAEVNKTSFKSAAKVLGELAQTNLHGKKVLLLMPMTYMNTSGQSVKQCIDYYNVSLEHILIVTDDIALPFGAMRLRMEGSAGGHNGLKSVEEHLGTLRYPRLRIGVGDRQMGDLADHVLGRFSKEESASLPLVVERAQQVLDLWLFSGAEAAMQCANAKKQ